MKSQAQMSALSQHSLICVILLTTVSTRVIVRPSQAGILSKAQNHSNCPSLRGLRVFLLHSLATQTETSKARPNAVVRWRFPGGVEISHQNFITPGPAPRGLRLDRRPSRPRANSSLSAGGSNMHTCAQSDSPSHPLLLSCLNHLCFWHSGGRKGRN